MAKVGGNPQNLIPPKKGEPSRNPHGRPKKLPHLDALLAGVLGEKIQNSKGEKEIAATAILLSLRARALKGDVRAAEVILDRAYGKSIQRNADVFTDGTDKDIVVNVIFTEE